ncbi:hypothetical protein ACHAXT_002691, partial [Thalassiosira profunda]
LLQLALSLIPRLLPSIHEADRQLLENALEIMDDDRLQAYADQASTIDIGTITSRANVETLQRLRDNDPKLTNLAVCRERRRGRRVLGGGGRDSGFEYYCPSDPEDLGFAGTGAWWAGAFIGNNKNLRELVVYGSSFAEANNSLPKFLAGVSRNQSIRGIRLCGIDLSNVDILRTMNLFFENNANLRRVDVTRCDFGGEGDRLVSSMLRCCCQSLEEFKLDGNLDEGERPTRTIAALRTRTQLKYIFLDNMNVGSNECRTLAALPCFNNLQELNLMGNNFDDDGVEALMRALASDNRLRTLDLSYNPLITTRGLQSIVGILGRPTTKLSELYLLWNGVNDEGADILAGALANNRKLTTLGLLADSEDNTIARRRLIEANDNLITARGWQALVNALCNTSSLEATYRSNHFLRWLSASENNLPSIGDEDGGAAILSSLAFSLETNRSGAKEAARRKIIEHHLSSDEGMCHFAGMDRAVLPRVLAWVPDDELSLDRVYRLVRNLHSDMIGFVPTSVEAPAVRRSKRQKTGGH